MAMYLLKLGVENGITPQLFIDGGEEKPKVSDKTFFSIMKERNPALFSVMREDINRQVRLEEQAAINEGRMMTEMPAEDIEDEGGFLRPIEEEETI
jgi:hypothetical protein